MPHLDLRARDIPVPTGACLLYISSRPIDEIKRLINNSIDHFMNHSNSVMMRDVLPDYCLVISVPLLVNFLLSPAVPKAREGRYCNAPRLSVRLSVCLSVRLSITFSFSHCNSKTHLCIFSKLCRYMHHVMGVCCIVFDIAGMLFEFFMNFLNIEKN